MAISISGVEMCPPTPYQISKASDSGTEQYPGPTKPHDGTHKDACEQILVRWYGHWYFGGRDVPINSISNIKGQ
jgi:hypothetical protein